MPKQIDAKSRHSGLDPESDRRKCAPQEIPLEYRASSAPLDSGFRRNDGLSTRFNVGLRKLSLTEGNAAPTTNCRIHRTASHAAGFAFPETSKSKTTLAKLAAFLGSDKS